MFVCTFQCWIHVKEPSLHGLPCSLVYKQFVLKLCADDFFDDPLFLKLLLRFSYKKIQCTCRKIVAEVSKTRDRQRNRQRTTSKPIAYTRENTVYRVFG